MTVFIHKLNCIFTVLSMTEINEARMHVSSFCTFFPVQYERQKKKKKSNTQTGTVLLNTVYQSQGCCGSPGQPAGMFSLV